ncbi:MULTISPECIES: type I glutamate--ammonia ligase [Acetobacterium]|uniref:Glutamine synthetase n=1 Tax=Acetobacterium wieringae TaxID=52694 RepID=A0A1F2PFN5_9FIRM|nr:MULTISPECIES: type I glutamate--ammonia ligase [Acetobacterium]MEA4807054.1 type I glutamate--ammonia ligase [Acetobacterium wieringae]OFV70179.1 glutamine synthetase [Acetobacterium wieringae]OXS27084.1 MAG: type I glutamate--ammonia ligase [Acetobacterium sp. MES1]URN84598.1 type I glutamate--ammonia ligase [Acetobacterium wieringae]
MSLAKNIIEAMKFIEANDVKFIRLQFCDLFGQNRNIAITAMQIERALANGIPFDASLVVGFSESRYTDLILHPDISTMQLLPWRPQQGKVARILCDIRYPNGDIFEADSRYILKETIKRARDLGYQFNTSAECEFYLFKQDENGDPTTIPTDQAGYFDLAPYDRGENTRREICLTLEDMGFEIESSRHEAGRGQHEIDFKHDDALSAADKIMTFKTVVKTVAQRNGVHASFLPKPLMEEPGSGMHIHVSLLKNGQDIFENRDGVLSTEAKYFMAGVLAHVKGMTAIANPLVNSYKRLTGGKEAPRHIGWGFGNRSPLIRIPLEADEYYRFELRGPDPTCNPYLTFAIILAAGLEGIDKQLVLMDELKLDEEEITRDPLAIKNIQELPITLMEALTEMDADPLIKNVLGENLAAKYIELKTAEWMDYIKTVHPWEIERYLLTY